MPSIGGVRNGARNLIEVGDGSTFPTAGHLAAYAGLAPATRRSGSTSRREQAAQAGLLPPLGRSSGRHGIPGRLRQEDRPGHAPHPSPAAPRRHRRSRTAACPRPWCLRLRLGNDELTYGLGRRFDSSRARL
ncbi:transposase [Streptomyces erythrochromogenes]|uniref:transposase n=1 Tax=Streptomyces erythrochromogenes TaxID=285574 RepID=UPI0038661023